MKKLLLTFVLMVGIVLGLFAQQLTYQAVIRDNNQQLVVNTAVKATVTITFTTGTPATYSEEVNGTTNLHGLITIEFGDDALLGRDWTDATIAVKVVNAATPCIVYVNDEPRPVSAVPYALSVNGMAIQQYLETNHYVTETQVGRQIHDSIANIGASSTTQNHSHSNMAVLNATTATYTDADSIKLDGIASGAEVNVQADWNEATTTSDAYILNKPSIKDTVNDILNTKGYLTTHLSKAALRDSVASQIHDSIAAIGATSPTQDHSHTNIAILNATTAPYTDADSTKLDGVEAGAQKNVQADWAETNEDTCSFIRNKPELFSGSYNDLTDRPSINDTVNDILNTKGYLTTHLSETTIRGYVAGQIHDSIANIGGTSTTQDHTHSNMAILSATTATYTNTDSTKLDGIENGAQKNVQADWTETDVTKDAYINNKPEIPTVPTAVSAFTNDAGYLTKDSSVITNMQSDINALRTATTATDFSTLCTTIESTCTNVALQNGNNTFTGNNDFTGGTTTVASGITLGITNSANCGNVAVNACDLLNVFDSIQRTFNALTARIDALSDSLRKLRGATTPVFNSLEVVKTRNSLEVTADFDDGGADITDYNFCISGNSDMSESTCMPTTTNSSTFTDLTPATTYYVTVAATNLKGTTTSTVQPLTTANGIPVLNDTVETISLSNTEIKVRGQLESLGGASSVNVKVCAYTTSDHSDTPICGSAVTKNSAPADCELTVGGLTQNTHYYLALIASNDSNSDTVWTEATTLNIFIDVTSNKTDTITICGSPDTTVTYAVTVTGYTPTSYTWKVNGADSTSITGNTLTVHYTTFATNKVVCTVMGVSDTATTTISLGSTPAVLDLCEDCDAGSITLKGGNCISLTWVNNDDATKTGTVSSLTEDTVVLSADANVPAGIYTFTGTNRDGCTVKRTATLGKAVTHPCKVTSPKQGVQLSNSKWANREYFHGENLVDSVSDHEGNVYRVVQIGIGENAQCWLAENMRCKTSPSTGSTIVMDSMVKSYSSKSAGYYDNKESQYGKYGVLYNWCAFVDTFYAAGSHPELANDPNHNSTTWDLKLPNGNRRGICPEGWHVPTDKEWITMEQSVAPTATNIGSAITGSMGQNTDLSAMLSGGCDWTGNGNAAKTPNSYSNPNRNVTEFTALPAGGFFNDSFNGIGLNAYFWSVTSYFNMNNFQSFVHRLINNTAGVYHNAGSHDEGFSVRCLRDGGVTGGDVTFTCGTDSVKDIQNNEYPTVVIGTQCWMAQNLRTTTEVGNTWVPNADNVPDYGLLYDWAAVMQGASSSTANPSGVQGICPAGWHVPSSAEWTALTTAVNNKSSWKCGGTSNFIAKALASKTGWNGYGSNCAVGNAPENNNATGFSAFPAGYYKPEYIWDFSKYAYFWSSTEYSDNPSNARYRYIGYDSAKVLSTYDSKERGYSVRCLKDN